MSEYEFVGQRDQTLQTQNGLSPWDSYANHREIVTGFIKSSAPSDAKSLCVLGAGACYDLELKQLIQEFDQIALVDISSVDVASGLLLQQVERASEICTFQVDVLGIDDLLDKYAASPSNDRLNAIFSKLEQSSENLPQADCIASTCLLSQLLFKATKCVGEEHDRFVEVLQAVRFSHVSQMVSVLTSGGTGVLVTDFVSSESLPELTTTKDLKATVQKAIAERNFLHGLNPSMVAKVFDQPPLRNELLGIKVTDPWRWVTGDKVYACFAIVFKKK